jgi:uncharacterized protein (TIGR02300 family)
VANGAATGHIQRSTPDGGLGVAKPEWGAKRICHNCGARYYDMRRDPIICPKCGTEFDPEAFLKSRRTRVAAVEELEPVRARRAAPGEDFEDQVDEDVEADEDVDGLDEDEVGLDEADEGRIPVGDDEDNPADDIDEDLEDAEGDDVLLEDADELGDDDVDVDLDNDDEDR